MITIQILVAAVAVAAILTSVIVHMVDKKHETREVARLNAEITERKEEGDHLKEGLAKKEEENLHLKKQLEAQGYICTEVQIKVFDCPMHVPEGFKIITLNGKIVEDKDGKPVLYVNEDITLTDNQIVILQHEKTGKVDIWFYNGKYDGKEVTPGKGKM